MEIGCENWKMEGWKHQASRDGFRGQEGKERDHWAWKAGRRGGRTLPGAVEHRKLQGEEQRQYHNIDQCLHSLFLIPSAAFTFCSSQHGSSFVFIIGEKLEKLHPQSQCLVPTSAAGSGSPGHGAPKEPLQIKSFTVCLAAQGDF